MLQNPKNFTEYNGLRPYHQNILGFALMKVKNFLHSMSDCRDENPPIEHVLSNRAYIFYMS